MAFFFFFFFFLRWCAEVHLITEVPLCKTYGPLASYTDLVDPLEEPQFELPLSQGSPASLEAGALGARHVDLPGSCEGSG